MHMDYTRHYGQNIALETAEQIIPLGESQTIEFKKSLTQLKPAMETLCGFLNTDGGIIFIGVNQHGKVVGCDVSDRTQ